MNICLIAESSWDIECVEKQGFIIDSCFAHNDFFSSTRANEKNTKLMFRVLMLIKIFFKVFFWVIRGKKVLFSSFNAEALFVANLYSKNQSVSLFCPNVMAKPDIDMKGKRHYLHEVYSSFSGKIIVTDKVTFDALNDYSPVLSANYYDFLVPKKNVLNSVLFIVVMPAVLSHKSTMLKKDDFYNFALYLINWLSHSKLDFVILPHPRESEDIKKLSTLPKGINIISQKDLSLNKRAKCYLSSYSSLSLNKRYGGKFGFWVKHPNYNLLPSGIDEQYLIDFKDMYEN